MFSNAKDIFCRCIEVARTYVAQRIDIDIILTAVSSSWTGIDFFARGVNHEASKTNGASTCHLSTQALAVICLFHDL